MERVIDRLAALGVEVRVVMVDRWFPTFDLLDALRARDIFSHNVWGAPATRKGRPPVEVTLILTNPRGRRPSEIQEDCMSGAKSEADSLKEIMVMVTTAKPPRSKKARQRWAVRLCQRYHVRWQIETSFRDVKRMVPASNARTNCRKLLMFSAAFWGFNLW